MKEPACLVPEASNGEGEVNQVCALRESVSFGRFMSESLDWGKWSSFRHNRYLEEIEKVSIPGSVAQKKAYFEAQHKRINAKKSATLADQAKAYTSEVEKVGEVLVESSLRNESSLIVEDAENMKKDTEMELKWTSPLKKQPLKESSVTNQELNKSAEKKPRDPIPNVPLRRSSRIPHSPASNPVSSIRSVREIQSSPGSEKNVVDPKDRNQLIRKSPAFEKVGKGARNSSKASQSQLHPLRTIVKPSSSPAPNNQSEKGRTKTPSQETTCGRRKADSDLCSLSPDCLKCSSTRGVRARTHIVSSSLSFRTDERAEKRKEFFLNLEKEVDGKDDKKTQRQGTTRFYLHAADRPNLKGKSNAKRFQI